MKAPLTIPGRVLKIARHALDEPNSRPLGGLRFEAAGESRVKVTATDGITWIEVEAETEANDLPVGTVPREACWAARNAAVVRFEPTPEGVTLWRDGSETHAEYRDEGSGWPKRPPNTPRSYVTVLVDPLRLARLLKTVAEQTFEAGSVELRISLQQPSADVIEIRYDADSNKGLSVRAILMPMGRDNV